MNLSDADPLHLAPLEMVHETRWMDALMAKGPPRAVSLPPIFSYSGWHTSIAVRPEQIRAAEDLICRRYAWRGYRVPATEPSGACSIDKGLQVMLLAQKAGRLMGTLTVRPDTRHGLLAEKTYAGELQKMRRDGRRLGELVKLAVEEGADWRAALDALVQSAYLITRMVHGLTDVIIEVNPRHVRFYQRVFGFAAGAAERFCERVGAPSVLLCLDLERFGRKLQLAA
jgi:hypothetical protein